MGIMDKFLNIMKLNDDEDEDEDYYEEDEYLDEEEEEEQRPARRRASKSRNIDDDYEERSKKPAFSKVTPLRPVSRKTSTMSNGMEVCVIKPTSVEEEREITETLLEDRTVVLNLEGLDVDIAQRILDFISGSCFAISGNLQKISHYIFIITPPSVDVSGDFQEMLNGGYDEPIDSGM